MRMSTKWFALLAMVTTGALVLGTACDGDDGAASSDDVQEDVATDTAGDTEPDDVVEPPATFVAGVAERDLGFPMGSPTVGYGPTSGGPKTPYSKTYPGTDARHTDLTAKAVVMRRGHDVVALVRTDTVGMWQDIVRDAQTRLREEGHDDLADGLVVVATHTHSSGGRVFDHFFGEIAVGPFLPAFYQRLRESIVESAIAADEATVPARVGHTTVQVPSLHNDRRCENGPIQDDTLGLVKLERVEDDSTLAILVNYAMHGTVLGSSDFVLSSDASGAVEHGIEHALDEPTDVLFLQSWAGDMAPRYPKDRVTEAGFDLRERYTELDAIAIEAAEVITPALDGIETTDEPEIRVVTEPFPIDSAEINPPEFAEKYPYGGIYCINAEGRCGEDAEPFTPSDLACLLDGFDEEMTVFWTWISAVRVGDLGLVTLPGEPLTSVGTDLRDEALEATGLEDVFVLGYGQGYLSYLLHADDYYMGGYEASSALMGPGFGQYLVDMGASIAGRLVDPEAPLAFEPVDLEAWDSQQWDDLSFEEAEGAAEIVTQPTSSGEVRTVSWNGGHPAVDEPVVALERQEGEEWQAVTYPSGHAFDSRAGHIETSLAPEPSWKEEPSLDARTFVWTARLPARFSVTPAGGQLEGTFRFVIRGERPDSYELVSEPFDLAPAG
ncbi:MAG: neutral/alkaline non-lysosomal ceramidase N-terminal domain-containing protein [Myxococcota bacterium]